MFTLFHQLKNQHKDHQTSVADTITKRILFVCVNYIYVTDVCVHLKSLTGRVGQHDSRDVTTNHCQAGEDAAGQDAKLQREAQSSRINAKPTYNDFVTLGFE